MTNIKLPCFYYPTTVTILDDDQVFLENITANLSNNIPYKQLDNPYEALSFLKTQQIKIPTSRDYLEASSNSSDNFIQHGKRAVNVNILDIHKNLYYRDRFKVPSVIVVDYDMPGMNGIEFCQELEDYSIKKIMLTGVADHKIANNAFNEGVIHKFILKDDPNVFKALDNAIFAMQQSYFTDLSDLATKNITATSFSYLDNDKFIRFFQEFIKKNSIVEFYLIDPEGSFLLIDDKGELIWFVTKSDQSCENDYQIATDYNAPDDIINSLKDKSKLLFLFSEEDYQKTVETWSAHLYQSNEVPDVQRCHYTIIKNEQAYEISGLHKEKIFSFYNFLQTK